MNDSKIPTTKARRKKNWSFSAGPYRFRITYRPESDTIPPNPVGLPIVVSVGSNTATISFVSPGDDGATGNVAGYELRLMAGTAMTASNFGLGASPVMRPVPAGGLPGQLVTVTLDQLSPSTDYDLGVRAEDDCTNVSDLVVLHFTTAPAPYGTVAPCGCGSAPGAAAPTAVVAFALFFAARRRRRRAR